jgi:hypothetical protein
MMDAINSSETLVLARAKRRHIPKDGILGILHVSVDFEHTYALAIHVTLV